MPYEKIDNQEPMNIADEVPFEILDGWEWCRLSNCAYHIGSKENQILSKKVKQEGHIPVVNQSKTLLRLL